MFAIPNKIVIGDVESPILTFENDAIKEVLEETGISAVGEELYIDQCSLCQIPDTPARR